LGFGRELGVSSREATKYADNSIGNLRYSTSLSFLCRIEGSADHRKNLARIQTSFTRNNRKLEMSERSRKKKIGCGSVLLVLALVGMFEFLPDSFDDLLIPQSDKENLMMWNI
jgi:hypothetical protein